MPKRRVAVIAASLAVLVLAGALAWGAAKWSRGIQAEASGAPPASPPASQAVPVTVIGTLGAPADVQEAATRLMHSRVGYAIGRSDKTYLIISTGSDSVRTRVSRAVGQPGTGSPTHVDVDLNTDGAGERLLVATTPLTGRAEYQFNLDGVSAAIPTLHNDHGLDLVTLPDTGGFAVLAPAPELLVTGPVIAVRGYARVFEAQFTVRVVSPKGRLLGEQHVAAAAGAPSWGSFAAEVRVDGTDLPETGFVVFEEGQTGAKLAVPVRFRAPSQMG